MGPSAYGDQAFVEAKRTSAPDTPVDRVFRSAIGWPAMVQIGLSVLMIVPSILLMTVSSSYGAFGSVLLILAVATPLWHLASTKYRIGDGDLTVSKLFRRRRVPLTDITAVKRWPNWQYPVGLREDFSLSRARLLIAYADSRVFVSPRKEQDFLAALGHPIDA